MTVASRTRRSPRCAARSRSEQWKNSRNRAGRTAERPSPVPREGPPNCWIRWWRGRCLVSGDPGQVSRDIQDMTMEDHAHGPGWLCRQRGARRGPQRQGGVRNPRHLSRLALRADRRYRELGDDGLVARSKRPHSSPTRVPARVEDEIVALRKELTELGVDAGAHTIYYHLQVRHRRRRAAVPSVRRSGGRCPGGVS
jgi:hypothetical protein